MICPNCGNKTYTEEAPKGINVENIEYFNNHKKEIQTQGIIKICQQRGWTQKDLIRYGYTTCKTREYNKTK